MPDLIAADAAEAAVLADIIRRPDDLAEVAPLLRQEDFRLDRNQRVYRHALALWDQRQPVDLAALAHSLKLAGELEDVTYAYLAQLLEVAWSGKGAAYHARIVRDNGIFRRLEMVAGQIGELAR